MWINADEIEKNINTSGQLDFSKYKITSSTRSIRYHFRKSTFSPLKSSVHNIHSYLSVRNNILFVNTTIDSYIAADLAEYIRNKLCDTLISFSFETVMSAKHKLAFLEKAKKKGFSIYLYFFCTEDPSININRVKVRVAQFGHNVPSKTIEERYYKTLENLKRAIQLADKAYLFDNSGQAAILFAEISNGRYNLVGEKNAPNWFVKYVLS